MREIGQLHDGLVRYNKAFDSRGAGDAEAARGLVFTAMRAMEPWIRERVRLLELPYEEAKALNVLATQMPASVHWLAAMQPDAVAYIAAKICVGAAYNEGKSTRTAMRIANLIEENYMYEELEQAEPALANSMSNKAKRWSRSSTRRKIMRKAAQVANIKSMGWTEEEKLKLGIKLIEVFVETTGYAELKLVRDYDKATSTQKILTMTDSVRARVDARKSILAETEPVHRPMVCKPLDWTSPISGGYRTKRMQTPILRVRKRKITKGVVEELFTKEIPQVYSAVNAVQATAWRVNRPIYELMNQCREDGLDTGGLPTNVELPLPPLPPGLPEYSKDQQLDEQQQARLVEWKTEARGIHGVNAAEASKWIALTTKLIQTEEVVDEEAIYFPHALDFRGRMYPMSAELSPQSDDLSKALLQFAEGKPLGESGGYWLCVHLANLMGKDKQSFADRVVWTQAHHNEIMRSAQRPMDHQWWTKADDPWCFLAACFEYAGWQTQGDSYVSHLPIAMDGSCSGLQHFSAMLRDQRGAEATNLTATDTPSDIYNEVLELVKVKLNASKEPLAKVWYDNVDRKIVKRPCMTYAYGVTAVGIRDQITDEIRKRQSGDYLPGTRNWDAGRFLAPFVQEAIEEVVERAAEAMDWLKSVTNQLNKEEVPEGEDGESETMVPDGVPTGWTTPLGFVVTQPYMKMKGKRINLLFNGERLQLTLSIEGNKIDAKNQGGGHHNLVRCDSRLVRCPCVRR
jgi:DNA-directed RNA polymerase